MKKVVQFLENYAQFLALGIAAIWVIFVAYTYWLSEPVSATVDGQKKTPQEVEAWIAQNPVQRLASAEKAPVSVPSSLVNFDAAGPFGLALRSPTGPNYMPVRPNMQPNTALAIAIDQHGPGDEHPLQCPLPQVAAPTVLGTTQGQSVVMLGTGMNGAAPVGLPAQPPPPAQPQPAGQIPPPPPMSPTDIVWVTPSFRFQAADQAKLFADANIPNYLSQNVTVLSVELQREELLPDGTSWSKPVTVKVLNPPPQPLPTAQDPAQEAAYLDWARSHQAEILIPPFPTMFTGEHGDAWWSFTMDNPNNKAGVAAGNFNPASPGPGPFTEDQIRQIVQFQNQQKLEATKNKNKPASPPHQGPHKTGFNSSALSPALAAMPNNAQDVYAADAPPPGMGPAPSPTDWGAGGGPPSGPAQVPGHPGIPSTNPAFAGMGTAPTQPFDIKTTADFEFYAHDIGIVGSSDNGPKPGHTYRYRAVIKILNPLYGHAPAVKNPGDEKIFAISGTSDWTSNVFVPPLSYVFVASNQATFPVKIDTFEWKSGVWVKTNGQPGTPGKYYAGDSIGKTGFTVVDLNPDPVPNPDHPAARVILSNENGALVVRTATEDQQDPIRKFLAQVAKVMNTGANAGGVPGQ